MNYGFLIRNDRCIGCHACSTACKSENDVPVGVNRTWVKNVEKGRYPDVRRSFQVTRCNHCANPPCVTICPVTAMYQRDDGIVEFDPDRCIGCKACLQACPYDAIYIDPNSGTAAKCHFCAHRTDIGLEPACVVVCPEHAIIAGDIDDPATEISRQLAHYDVTVRKPEQGTLPKVFYVDGDEAALTPTATERTPRSFAWADVAPLHGKGAKGTEPGDAAGRPSGRGAGAAEWREGPPGHADAGPGHAEAGPGRADATTGHAGSGRADAGSGGGDATTGHAGSGRADAGSGRADAGSGRADAGSGRADAGSGRADASASAAGRGPGAAAGAPVGRGGHGRGRGDAGATHGRPRPGGSPRPTAGGGWAGPITIGSGRMAGEMVRNVYNAQHRVPWHWPVPAYLVTKGIGTGLFMILALGHLLGLFRHAAADYLVTGFLALLFTGVTTTLLVLDLERPERFLRILTRPQWRSWLTKGGYLLVAFTLVAAAWWLLELGATAGWWEPDVASDWRPWAFALGAPLAGAVAVYTAFLFGQAEGRDLWQSPLLPVHLLVQAFLAGAATLLVVAPFLDPAPAFARVVGITFVAALVADLLMVLMGEMGMSHASENAARAAAMIRRGPYRNWFWWGALAVGHAAPLALVLVGNVWAAVLAGLLAIVGLYAWEHAFVMAPQEVPNS